ncbi:hypothetical protein RB196_34555 [Streptomyces sp. PmtA]|uniref:hypothetical protein n=1 Tax=Streptomyces sp. PmtA TaxID=3074275 RepID=UPI0030155F93
MAIDLTDTVRLMKANRQRHKHLLQRAEVFRQRATDDNAALQAARQGLYDEALVPACDTLQSFKHGDFAELTAIQPPAVGDTVVIDLRRPSMVPMKAAAIVLAGGALSLLGPLAVGHLTEAGAYRAVRAFGSASTGRAIRTLSGAAADSATLARWGKGAISAGGGGTAAGARTLSNIHSTSVNLARQVIVKTQVDMFKEGRLDRGRDLERHEAEMDEAQEALHERFADMQQVLQGLRSALMQRIPSFTVLVEADEGAVLDDFQRAEVEAMVDLVRFSAMAMHCPITDADGRITEESGRLVSEAWALLEAIEGA